MGSKEGGNNIQGSLPANAIDDTEHFQFRFRCEAISALDLKRGCTKPLSRKGVFQGDRKELILGSGPHGPNRGKNSPSPAEDFEVVHSLHPEGKLLLPSFGEAHVGMWVYETGNERETLAVHLCIHITR